MGNGYPLTQRSRSRPLFSKLAQSCNPATSYPSCKTIRLRSIHPYAREEAITAPVYLQRERERQTILLLLILPINSKRNNLSPSLERDNQSLRPIGDGVQVLLLIANFFLAFFHTFSAESRRCSIGILDDPHLPSCFSFHSG